MIDYIGERQKLIDIETAMHFSSDLDGTLTEDELKVDAILNKLRGLLKTDTLNVVIHDYFKNFVSYFQIPSATRQ